MTENITYIGWTILLTMTVMTVFQIFHYLVIGTTILRSNRSKACKKNNCSTTKQPVSIIICAKNEEDNLKNFLPLILEQDYPEFEVIIVNDGSFDNTANLISNFQKDYNNLYITTIPTETRIVSHKKLAITVGIKAAKHEILLFTDADCRPWTKHWIDSIVKNFNTETEFVIGYGGYYRTGSFIGKLTQYDALTNAMQYIGFAAFGKPYMGVGRNIAYRKSTFFKQKGFAGFLHVAAGDDDLLINAFGTKDNTHIETSLQSKTMSLPKTTLKDWYYQKIKHLAAIKAYKSYSKILLAVEPISRVLLYASIITLTTIYWHNTTILSIAACCFLLKISLQTLVINITAKRYKEKTFLMSDILIFDIFLPLITIYIMTIARITNRKIRYV